MIRDKNKYSYIWRISMMNKYENRPWTGTLLTILLFSFITIIGLTGCTVNKKASAVTPSSSETRDGNPNVPENQSPVYYGDWIISQVQAFGVGTYSDKDAESLIGKRLSFTADKASRFGDQLSGIGKEADNPTYTEAVISKNDFLAEYRISFDNLGIKVDNVMEVCVSNSEGTISTFFVKDDNTLIIVGGGTYFELVRESLYKVQ